MKVYPLRIAPILTIFTQNESSWRDLSFETHFVFRWFFSRRAVDGCSVDGRRMIFGRPFSHDKIRWISKIQISNFKFQISNFNWPGLGPVRAVPSVRAVPPQPWPIEIWNLKINFFVRSIDRSIDWTIDRSTIDESFFPFWPQAVC